MTSDMEPVPGPTNVTPDLRFRKKHGFWKMLYTIQENIVGGPEKGRAEELLRRNLAQLKAFGMVVKTRFTNSIN